MNEEVVQFNSETGEWSVYDKTWSQIKDNTSNTTSGVRYSLEAPWVYFVLVLNVTYQTESEVIEKAKSIVKSLYR